MATKFMAGKRIIGNKSDRDGADKIAVSLNNFLSTVHSDDGVWSPRVVKTSVYAKTGFEELFVVSSMELLFN